MTWWGPSRPSYDLTKSNCSIPNISKKKGGKVAQLKGIFSAWSSLLNYIRALYSLRNTENQV